MGVLLGIWGFLAKVPGWVYLIIAFIGLGFYIHHHGAQSVQKKWDEAQAVYEAQQAAIKEENEAKVRRAEEENKQLALKHKATTNRITKEFNENKAYIDDLVYANKSLRGMLLGPGFSSPGTPSEANPGSSGSGDGASCPTRILSERAASDFEQLGKQAEHDTAVARACQDFVRSNGMSPK